MDDIAKLEGLHHAAAAATNAAAAAAAAGIPSIVNAEGLLQHLPRTGNNKPMTTAAAPKFKKAPDAPKRFKSAFIIYSAEKHKEIKAEFARQGRAEKTTDIAKLVSEAWREMPPAEKEVWEKKARKDKARYEIEKAAYKGPWKVPANKRTPKDPSAPKRPMSAFLAFSNKRRAGLKRENPDATNADLSKMLSKTWREAPQELRQKYMDEEAELRAKYKVEMAKWRKKVAEEKKKEREQREELALQAVERQSEANTAAAAAAPMLPEQNMYANPYMQLGINGFMGNMGNPAAAAQPDSNSNYLMGAAAAASNPLYNLGGQAAQQQLLNQLVSQQLKQSMNPGWFQNIQAMNQQGLQQLQNMQMPNTTTQLPGLPQGMPPPPQNGFNMGFPQGFPQGFQGLQQQQQALGLPQQQQQQLAKPPEQQLQQQQPTQQQQPFMDTMQRAVMEAQQQQQNKEENQQQTFQM